MYNRYLTAVRQPCPPALPSCGHGPEPDGFCGAETPPQEPPPGGLLGALSQRLSGFRIDAETLVMLAVMWFVLGGPDGEPDTELLAVLVVLLLLGV